ncbi:alpha/beta fold hydrolase [Nevskia soli]|uniref:alpha/beta fold hydrolase n=1 Tax=Nevskia soli TaxID=418856 RepID=UPI0004A6FCC6|nr:alpha/beta hydrolase [Nevskia soli]
MSTNSFSDDVGLLARRKILVGASTTALALVSSGMAGGAFAKQPDAATGGALSHGRGAPRRAANTIIMTDGTVIYYKDWGTGPAVVFSHGYPLSSDAWENQMFFLSQHGYRVIAHDRRGFGRSSQPGHGNDMDTYADDLAALAEALDLKDATFIGHSMGGGEIARYIGRHGQKRVGKIALVGAVPPFLLQTPSNPGGAPMSVFDDMRQAVLADRSQWYKDVTMPYYSYNRAGAKVSEGIRDEFWRQGMVTGMPAAYHAIGAFAETDFTDNLKSITVPTLVIHGLDDQIVPFELSGKRSAELVKNARLITYEKGSHGLILTERDRVNEDLLAFLKS